MRIYLPLLVLLLLSTANADTNMTEKHDYQYIPPLSLDDGINTAALSQTELGFSYINQLMTKAVTPGPKGYQELHSLLIYKDDALVLEEYFSGNNDAINFSDNIKRDSSPAPVKWHRDRKHYVASVNKALTASLAGIALEQLGLSVNQPIAELLPQYQHYFSNTKIKQLTLHHVLSMQLGFEWDEWNKNDLALMWQADDFVDFLLARPNQGPGKQWQYNSAAPNLLLTLLQQQLKQPIQAWADRVFYQKLGITDYVWHKQANGIGEGSARMHMRPRDMLKVGITYLNQGKWQDEQVIPKSWVKQATRLQARSDAGDYGYYFWLRRLAGIDYISADGDGGQYINIFPEQNMVIVMTQGNYLNWPLYNQQAQDIMANYIFPALVQRTGINPKP